MVRPRDFISKGTKISSMIREAEHYLVRLQLILMGIYFIFLRTGNSLIPPIESPLHRTSNFQNKLCSWYGEQDGSHSHFTLHWQLA